MIPRMREAVAIRPDGRGAGIAHGATPRSEDGDECTRNVGYRFAEDSSTIEAEAGEQSVQASFDGAHVSADVAEDCRGDHANPVWHMPIGEGCE